MTKGPISTTEQSDESLGLDDRVKPVSLRDVAARAGVGVAAVSSVLNAARSTTRVSESTRSRVLEIAREMRYQPNAAARALRGGATKTLAVLFGTEKASVAVTNSYVNTVWQGIILGVEEARYNVIILGEPWRSADRSLSALRDGRADGVIAIGVPMESDLVATLSSNRIPVLVIGGDSDLDFVVSVDVDNKAGATLAMTHLLELGHTRIAYLAGPEYQASTWERRETYHGELRRAGIAAPDAYDVPGSNRPEDAIESAGRLLELPEPPTAIFAANDKIALYAMQAARSKRLEVPRDLSIVGFDDRPVREVELSGLTTIRQPLAEIGAVGTKMLIAKLQGVAGSPSRRVFEPQLIVRTSTAAAI